MRPIESARIRHHLAITPEQGQRFAKSIRGMLSADKFTEAGEHINRHLDDLAEQKAKQEAER